MAETLRLLALGISVLVASVTDWRWRRIPNALTLPAIVIAIVLWWPDAGWRGVGLAFLCALVTLIAAMLFQIGGVVGGGDVKLLAAVAAFSGWILFREILVWTALFGGAVALIILIYRRALIPLLRNMAHSTIDFLRWGMVNDPVSGEGHKIPYALIIAGGSGCAIAATQLGYRFF